MELTKRFCSSSLVLRVTLRVGVRVFLPHDLAGGGVAGAAVQTALLPAFVTLSF